MTLQIKSASVRRYKIRYSKIIFKLEIILIIIFFSGLFMAGDEVWLLPALTLYFLITFIFFSSYSISKQIPEGLIVEFKSSPDRLIWYDSSKETSFLMEDVDIRLSRWLVLLKLVNRSGKWYLIVLQDSFDDINHYSHFRQHLKNNRDNLC